MSVNRAIIHTHIHAQQCGCKNIRTCRWIIVGMGSTIVRWRYVVPRRLSSYPQWFLTCIHMLILLYSNMSTRCLGYLLSWVRVVLGTNCPECESPTMPAKSLFRSVHIRAQVEKQATWIFRTPMRRNWRDAGDASRNFKYACAYNRYPLKSLPIWHIPEIAAGDIHGYILLL